MDYFKLATKLPLVISGITGIVHLVKGAPDGSKKEAVLAAIPASIALAEFGVDKDFLNDATIAKLVDAYIDAEAAVAKAREALKEGILSKKK